MTCAWCGVDLTECKRPVLRHGQTFCPKPQCLTEYEETYHEEIAERAKAFGSTIHGTQTGRAVSEQPRAYPEIRERDTLYSYMVSLGLIPATQLVTKYCDLGKVMVAGDKLTIARIQELLDQGIERAVTDAERIRLREAGKVMHVPIRY